MILSFYTHTRATIKPQKQLYKERFLI